MELSKLCNSVLTPPRIIVLSQELLCQIFQVSPNVEPNISNPLSPLFSTTSDKQQPLAEVAARILGNIIPRSTVCLVCIEIVVVGGSGGDDDGSNGDGIGGGDECVGGAVHLARRSLVEGGNSEIGGDGDE
ncbi:hypothetical protein Tco_1384549 [Tanacetum coccineum]